MKQIIGLIIFLFIGFNTMIQAQTYASIKVKVKDVCEPAANMTCVIGYTNENGVPMQVSIFDYKNKKGVTTISDPELPDIPFPCPAGYNTFNSFFIPDGTSNDTGLGVIDGILYVNQNNPTKDFFYWVFTTSVTFTNFDDWENALNN